MKIAVLTLTRDRLDYTKHCFQTLRDNAGCEFDWYILDQSSQDGTPDWLLQQEDLDVTCLDENIGLCKGLNLLLDQVLDASAYDCLVRFDNDAEVLQPDTLAEICRLAVQFETILAPRVLGLRQPPPPIRCFELDGHPFTETELLGGIFMAIPARLFSRHGYRYNEAFPPWTGDEDICRWWRTRRGHCGYIETFAVNHYLTTDGQEADESQAGYWSRKLTEMAAA